MIHFVYLLAEFIVYSRTGRSLLDGIIEIQAESVHYHLYV